MSAFFFYCPAPHRALHSFPTRRSSDLGFGDPPLGAIAVLHQVADAAQFEKRHAVQRADVGRRCPYHRYAQRAEADRKSTRLNSSHVSISYAVFCLKKKKKTTTNTQQHT